MISLGLTSVTFRNLSVEDIIDLAKKTDVRNIEWGGDLHVKNEEEAAYVYNMCESNGIRCCSYGSYYKAGTYGTDYMEHFEKTLKTALKLQCDTIRIWAYNKPSSDVYNDSHEYKAIINEMREIADFAALHNLSVSFEHHQKTLTDDIDSAISLIKNIDKKNVLMYWQAQVKYSFDENKRALSLFKPYIKNLHISNQIQNGYLLLNQMQHQLKEYIEIVKELDVVVLIEFVKDNNLESYYDDIEVLKKIVNEANE